MWMHSFISSGLLEKGAINAFEDKVLYEPSHDFALWPFYFAPTKVLYKKILQE